MTYEPVSVESLLTHQDWALRLARRLVHEEGEAEDLVQRTWMAALRRPPDSERGARAWIRKVILNLARERHRRGRTRERHERAFPRLEGDVPDALEVLSRAEIRKLLSEQLLELAEPYRSAVLQRYYDGQSSVEIARRLGIPAGTVRWRLKVGLDQLRAGLDRRANGDRSRWVSALLAFAPGGIEASDDDAPSEAPASIGPAPALGLPGPASWIALAGAGLLGAVFLVRDPEREPREHVVRADMGAAPVVGDAEWVPTSENARVERSALPSGPGLGASADSEANGLRILVVDESAAPVPGARVLVAGTQGFEERAVSDAEGRAWLAVRPQDPGSLGLPATRGRIGVRALAEGREASPLVHVAPPFSPAHEVRLVVGGPDVRLVGRVVDRRGQAIPGATVAWFDPDKRMDGLMEGDFSSPSYLSATSDSEGRFVLANLPNGRGTLGCFATGFAYVSVELDDLSQAPADLVLERGARVRGTVRWPDDRPAAGVSVFCEPRFKAAEWVTGLPSYDVQWRGFGEATRTDAEGRFLLEGVKAGRGRLLWARDERTGLVASTSLTLENEREEQWDAELAEHTGFRLRLVDEQGQALPGWFVSLRRPQQSLWWLRRRATDAEGRLFVPDCPEVEVFVDVYSPTDIGASYAWRRLRPSPEEVLIQVETRITSTLSGRLLDDLGQPDLRGQLILQSVDTTQATPVPRDEQGNFELRLVPGHYRLVLELDRTVARLSRFAVRKGEGRDLGTVISPPLGTLRLDATSLKGSTTSRDYSIYSVAMDWGFVQRVAHGPLEGELLFQMFPGNYRVLAFDGGATPITHFVEVQAHAETRLELRR